MCALNPLPQIAHATTPDGQTFAGKTWSDSSLPVKTCFTVSNGVRTISDTGATGASIIGVQFSAHPVATCP